MRPFAPLLALSLAAALVGPPSRALAQFDEPRPAAVEPAFSTNSDVRDEAGMFSREAVRDAKARLAAIERTYRVPTMIETIESLGGEAAEVAAQRMAKRLGPMAKGVFILLAKADRKVEVLVSRDNGALNVRSRRIAIRDAMTDEFRREGYDSGLIKGVEAIDRALASIRVEEGKSPIPTPTTAPTGSTTSVMTAPTRPVEVEPVATPGGTGGGGLVKRGMARLTQAGAKRLVAAAEARATEIGHRANIAVVDDGGHLLAFCRMDDARPASAGTAITKAVSAATFRQATGPMPPASGTAPNGSTDILLNLALQEAAHSGGGKFTPLIGGVPITVDGQVVGGIGLAGGTGDSDLDVARTAVARFNAEVQAAPATTPASPATNNAPFSYSFPIGQGAAPAFPR